MKRFFAICLVASMTLTCLCACNNTQPQEEIKETETQEESLYRDFYEEEFWAAHFVGTDSNNFFWPEPETVEEEQTRTTSTQTETALNCILKEEGHNNLSASGFWAPKMAVGDYQFTWSVVQSDFSPLYNMYEAGFVQSWSDIPTVDLTNSDRWGSPRAQQTVMFGGEIYAAIYPSSGGGFGRLYYNKILAQELNASTLPQDLYEQNNWTWDSFETYLESVTVHDDSRNVYGLSLPTDETPLAYCAVFSNGGEFVRIGEDGVASFALTENNALEAIDWAAYMMKQPTVILDSVFPPDMWACEETVFILGPDGFGTASTGSSAHYGLDNLEDIRCIPFPRGPKGDGSVGGAYATSGGGTIILFGNDREDAGYVWNVFQEMGEQFRVVDEEAWIRKTFFQDDENDRDSYNNWKFIQENFNLDYATQMGSSVNDLKRALRQAMHGNATSMEAMSGVAGTVQNQLDIAMNNQ